MITKLALTCLLAVTSTAAFAADDIVAIAKSTSTFKTLTAALDGTESSAMLKEVGPFTVFAPSDDAFAKLPEGTVEELLKPENKEKLDAILAYHVLRGKLLAADVKSMKARTASGAMVEIKMEGNSILVNNAMVIKADVTASNGVIHVIDTVLMPPVD